MSPGQAVPDPTFLGRTHRLLISLLGSTRLHEASGENCALLYTTKEHPRVAREAKRSQFGGGHRARGAQKGPSSSCDQTHALYGGPAIRGSGACV